MGGLRFTDPRSAAKKLPFALKMPDASLVESPAIIYVRPGRKNVPTEAHVVFGDGPAYTVQLIAVKVPKQKLSAQVNGRYRGLGGRLSTFDKEWRLADINGNEAKVIEPGLDNSGQVYQSDRPGIVYWWDGGVHYVLYGTSGPDGTPLPELLAIARSMR